MRLNFRAFSWRKSELPLITFHLLFLNISKCDVKEAIFLFIGLFLEIRITNNELFNTVFVQCVNNFFDNSTHEYCYTRTNLDSLVTTKKDQSRSRFIMKQLVMLIADHALRCSSMPLNVKYRLKTLISYLFTDELLG